MTKQETYDHPPPGVDTPLLSALIDLIGRAGAKNFQLGWIEEHQPHVWYAVADFPQGQDAAAAMDPTAAAARLAEQLLDGGTCTHCLRPSGLDLDTKHPMTQVLADRLPALANYICWYRYEVTSHTFRRGCE